MREIYSRESLTNQYTTNISWEKILQESQLMHLTSFNRNTHKFQLYFNMKDTHNTDFFKQKLTSINIFLLVICFKCHTCISREDKEKKKTFILQMTHLKLHFSCTKTPVLLLKVCVMLHVEINWLSHL